MRDNQELQLKILNFEAGASLERKTRDLILRQTPIFTNGANPNTEGPTCQNIGGIFNIPPFVQIAGISPVIASELKVIERQDHKCLERNSNYSRGVPYRP